MRIMPKSILIVDDEEEILTFLEHFLQRFEISVTKATSGEEALAIYARQNVDFVFLDIQLQGIDGIKVLQGLKKMNPLAKVVMITGKFEKKLKEEAKSKGALDYITKPLDLTILRRVIDKYLLNDPIS